MRVSSCKPLPTRSSYDVQDCAWPLALTRCRRWYDYVRQFWWLIKWTTLSPLQSTDFSRNIRITRACTCACYYLGCFLWFLCIVFSRAAYAWGRWRSALNGTSSIAPEESPLWGVSAIHRIKSILLTPFACLSMFRLPKPYCALRSQHLLSEMHSLSITPELYSGTFHKKVLLLRFCSFVPSI